ncbi:hypothetical protein [Methanohalophilus portucalensis]|uniref:Uncharacterized protein n=2 Tax=Methanohalophilus portucalensis TaxID=39664 RepID=A0A1L9C2E3_9EURY|nr:hypothetical protein [Methanohalophilus portucalensis]ATU07326.1 hypothetical protein BKM01_00135 [Methanohalophilus portucalensis]OJH48631.1 hypothetical protein MPF_1933 [Methanohalophilus portucalensis FDF-1]RNI09527.1 hypothetical protein EFE41_09470 [Methanohalophilus portucalensis FDF-1]SMH40114.1 hypothetical protein SAMN06264941_1494 [Methanohalophilus portucalensis FDF-1]
MLESNGIYVNDFDAETTSYEKVGDEIHYEGDFKIDVEKKVDDKFKMLKTKGTFEGTIKPDGSMQVEYIGNNFNLHMILSNIGKNQETILYQFDQVMTVDGKTKKTNKIVQVPNEQIADVDGGMGTDISENEEFVSPFSSKTKVDLPSTAPWSSTLIYDDIQYADILATGAILTGILSYFGLAQAAALSAIAVAVGYAIAEYGDVDTRDIYLGFFLCLSPSSPMHVEVDYFYV